MATKQIKQSTDNILSLLRYLLCYLVCLVCLFSVSLVTAQVQQQAQQDDANSSNNSNSSNSSQPVQSIPCPGKFTVYDAALPTPPAGLSVRQTGVLSVSAQAEIRIATNGEINNHYYAFAHQLGSRRFRDLRQLRGQTIAVDLGEQGENYYLIAVPAGVEAKAVTQLQQQLADGEGRYQQLTVYPDLDALSTADKSKKPKAAGLNAISFSPQSVVSSSTADNADKSDKTDKTDKNKPLQIKACRLALRSL